MSLNLKILLLGVLTWLSLIAIIVLPLWVIKSSRTQKWSAAVSGWLGLSAPMAFFIWTLSSGPAELQLLKIGWPRYLLSLMAGLIVSGILVLLIRPTSAKHQTALLGYAACLGYFGFLKVLGWSLLPWLLMIAIIPAYVYLHRSRVTVGSSVLILHVMGTMTGLYMAFHLQEFLAAWEPFKDVVASMWLMITGVA